uniref:Replication-associated protein n=1 Tax=Pacific flying fox faeces associated circular DNA molecule-1 TaxID=1796019 RepID=A0A140CTI8_9ZZZZ|nr:replication-associated protein [Pacific flying fox faeces associated circular DNA molecule-1]
MADGGTAAGLPLSNRGVSEFSNPEGTLTACIDWLSGSVDLGAALSEAGGVYGDLMFDEETRQWIDFDAQNAHAAALQLFCFFFAGSGMELDAETKPGTFYAHRVSIRDDNGDHCGMIELGGEHCRRDNGKGVYTARIELTGTGCKLYGAAGSDHAKRWLELRAKLESCDGRLTRCDVAVDDLKGDYPIKLAQQWYADGLFKRRGQQPKARLIDDYDSGDGKTFYVGTKKSEKQLRVYEKGRELGDKDSPWVRYEAQFHNSNRKDLPLDLLRDPVAYLLGEYPVLSFINAVATRIEITKAAVEATWQSARRHIKRQYGATLNFISRHCPTPEALRAVIESCTSHRLPKWATGEVAKHWPELRQANQSHHAIGALVA